MICRCKYMHANEFGRKQVRYDNAFMVNSNIVTVVLRKQTFCNQGDVVTPDFAALDCYIHSTNTECIVFKFY